MILIIGYGNPLRSDDAVGQQIAQMMKEGLKRNDVEVQLVYQLTPELVESVSHARLVVFIDARIGDNAGEIMHEVVEAEKGTGAFTHHVTPASLLAEAHNLYGVVLVGVVISIVGASFDYGCDLSPELQQKLPTIADQVKAIIESSAKVQNYEENDYA